MTIPKDFVINASPTNSQRFALFDKTGKCIDNANGYGYISKKKAKNAGNFKANGGIERKHKIKDWWNKHQKLSNMLDEELFYYMKNGDELSINEYVKLALTLAKELNINDFNIKYLFYR